MIEAMGNLVLKLKGRIAERNDVEHAQEMALSNSSNLFTTTGG